MIAATPLTDQFTWNFATMCPNSIKEKSEILETPGERVLQFWLPVWWRGPKAPYEIGLTFWLLYVHCYTAAQSVLVFCKDGLFWSLWNLTFSMLDLLISCNFFSRVLIASKVPTALFLTHYLNLRKFQDIFFRKLAQVWYLVSVVINLNSSVSLSLGSNLIYSFSLICALYW